MLNQSLLELMSNSNRAPYTPTLSKSSVALAKLLVHLEKKIVFKKKKITSKYLASIALKIIQFMKSDCGELCQVKVCKIFHLTHLIMKVLETQLVLVKPGRDATSTYKSLGERKCAESLTYC